jgi:hypothetical protein
LPAEIQDKVYRPGESEETPIEIDFASERPESFSSEPIKVDVDVDE